LDALADGPRAARDLGEAAGLSPARRTNAVNLLEQVGAVHTSGEGRVSLAGEAPAEQAVEAAVAAAERHRRLVRSRIDVVREYAEATGCRRRHLLGYFGEQRDEACGHCDTCERGTAQEHVPTDDDGLTSSTPVRHPKWGDGVVLSTEDDRFTVLFDDHGYTTLSRDVVRDNDLLEVRENG
jgi:ATP-dependent DNA helicase RecQ